MPVATESDGEEKDCDWVVERCKLHLGRNDRSAAKAWILTARSLFPDNFAVQYEAFSLHLCCEEQKEAAKALADLYGKFPHEAKMRSCLADLIAAVTGSAADSKELQSKYDLFNLLPTHVQKSILLQASEETTDTLNKCRIWLIALKKFPDTATTIGLDLFDVLSQKPSKDYPVAADNPYKELLVNDVIPLLAESRDIIIEYSITRTSGQSVVLKTSHLCQWLESAASYYASITSQSLFCNRAHPCAGKPGWQKLHQLFMLTAEKCGWREIIHSKQIGPHLHCKMRWMGLVKISGYNPMVKQFEAPRPVAIACFYIAVFLFFEMAWEYCSPILFPGAAEGLSGSPDKPPWVLIEERLEKPKGDEKAAKRRKLDEYQAFLNIQTGFRSTDQKMMEAFHSSIDCWDFLQSNVTYRGEFSRLCQQWGAFDWVWLSSFRADMAVYKGDHNLAMQILQHEWHKVKADERSKPLYLRFILQMVNCSMLIGDAKASCSYASEVISLIPDPVRVRQATPSAAQSAATKPNAARHIKLLKCTGDDLLPYCIDVIIQTLKDVAFSDAKNEQALGQLLVLLQYNWPREEETFASVITTIQKRRKFNFPEFFQYIVTIDILEEVMYLANCESLQVNLLPQDTSTKSRTVTRGVNRGAREELVIAMEKQIQRCDEPIEPLLSNFFRNEKLHL